MANDPTDTTKYPLGTNDLYVAARNASDFDKVISGDQLSYENRFGDQIRSLYSINELFNEAEASADAAAASEAAAASSAIDADYSATVAAGAANWVGDWETSTGAGVAGTSYTYANLYVYLLKVNLANIQSSEPSFTNTDYQLINEIPFEPSVKPTMVLDFANENFEIYDGFGTGFAEKPLNNIVTHTRASSATGVDPIGRVGTVGTNIPRLVFEDGVAKGYLSEEARTNLLTQSEFENGLSDATTSGLVTLDSMDYGDGAVNAITMTRDANIESFARKSTPVTGGVTYTFSVFVEMSDGLPPSFTDANVASVNNDFYISCAGLFGDPRNYTIKHVFGRVYVVSDTNTPSGTATAISGVSKFNTNSPRTFKVTGYQLEVGSFPTSYIKTQASTVTRSSESMVRTLGNEWNPNEGTFVVEFDVFGGDLDGAKGIISGGADAAHLYFNNGFLQCFNGTENILTGFTIDYGVKYILAISMSLENGVILAGNGENIQGSIPAGNLLSISELKLFEPLTTKFASGTIKSLTYYPKALPANELQELSRL